MEDCYDGMKKAANNHNIFIYAIHDYHYMLPAAKLHTRLNEYDGNPYIENESDSIIAKSKTPTPSSYTKRFTCGLPS